MIAEIIESPNGSMLRMKPETSYDDQILSDMRMMWLQHGRAVETFTASDFERATVVAMDFALQLGKMNQE